MKKYSILAIALVLTASVFTGCRRNRVEPTHLPETMPSTMPATVPTTVPDIVETTEAARGTEHATDATTHTEGTGAMEETMGENNARTRRVG